MFKIEVLVKGEWVDAYGRKEGILPSYETLGDAGKAMWSHYEPAYRSISRVVKNKPGDSLKVP